MKIVAMIDSFKGSASSKALNEAILKGFSNEDEKINIPIADGGEGTMASLFDVYGGNYQKVQVKNALRRDRTVKYLVTTIKQQQVAIIESSLIIGIGQTIPSDETTKNGSSYDVGQVVADALEKQVEKIYLTLFFSHG